MRLYALVYKVFILKIRFKKTDPLLFLKLAGEKENSIQNEIACIVRYQVSHTYLQKTEK